MLRYISHSICFLLSSLTAFSQDLTLKVTGYDMHVEANWSGTTANHYNIYRKGPADENYNFFRTTQQQRILDWTGRINPQDGPYSYFVTALTLTGEVIATSDTLEAFIAEMSDEQFLDMTQEYTFRYFWEYAHPVSGMARERLGSGEIVTTGGTGFGVMAIITGIQRGYITREEGVDRLLQLVSFLQFADRFHGVYPHWMNGTTGEVYPFSTFDNGGDLVETAFLMQGLLAARGYFDDDNLKEATLRDVITSLWEDVEWDFYSRNNSGVLYWHWSPEFEWQMNFPIRGYNEAMIVYILAIASPTHPVPASYWDTGWAGAGYVSGLSWYGIKLFVGPPLGGPLFFAHYSYMGFDPRDKKDEYANYFQQNINHTLLNRAWCVANPLHFEGYGENSWGLTASDDPWGYLAHAPGGNTDNGTLTPAAAIPSMPYTPNESIAVLKHFYRAYGEELWGPFGFYDAFNPEENWFADSYIAIDQGPIINMIENYRSGILWESFMSNPEIQPALDAIGFMEDPVSVDGSPLDPSWSVYPTVVDDIVTVQINSSIQDYSVSLVDLLGRKVNTSMQVENSTQGSRLFIDPLSASGLVWIVLQHNGRMVAKPVWLR